MSNSPRYDIQYLSGTKALEPVKYHIDEVRTARWWWGHKTEYAIVSDFMTLGGFKTRDDAHSAARLCGFVWRGGL